MSSTLTVTSIRSGRRRGIFAETGACFGCACTQEVKAAIGPSPNPGLSLTAWPIGVCSFLAFATVSVSPRHPPGSVAQGVDVHSGIGAGRSTVNPLAGEHHELLVGNWRRVAHIAMGTRARRPCPSHQPGLEMRDELIRPHAASGRIEESSAEFAGRQAIPRHAQRRQMPVRRPRHA